MRYLQFLIASFLFLSFSVSANWQKINDVDYVWGPFTIYNIALFSETGEYQNGTRPLMLSLKYMKPVDGRDFAISLARSWSNLGITLPEQEKVVDRLRKIMPNIKKGDTLSYIALENKGYFVLNKTVIAEEFNADFNNAVVAVWLDERVEIGRALLSKQHKTVERIKATVQQTSESSATASDSPLPQAETAPQGATSSQDSAKSAQVVENSPTLATTAENQAVEKLQPDSKAEATPPTAEATPEKATTPASNPKSDKPQDEEVEIWEAVDPVFLDSETVV